jgi:AraC-like DNA-binding protein
LFYGLQPGGTFPFFRLPMHEVTDRIVELGALASALQRDLVSCAAGASPLAEKVVPIEKLLTLRAHNCKHDSWVNGLAANVVRLAGRISVDKIASEAGVTGRQLERRFLRDIGIGPKLFCRILRFQQIFRAVEEREAGWASVAYDCGYYDQAHLIRDFQQFAGQTPGVLFSQPGLLTESFTRKHRRSDFSNTGIEY